MLQPVNQIKFYTNNNLLRTKQNTDKTHTDSFVNNKSLPVSFGWCEKHHVRSKEISMIFLNQLKLQNAKEQEANYKKTRLEYLDIANNSNKEAMNFLMQFTNRQKNEAEFIPLWSLMNNEELRTEMNKSPIFKDPVQNLISLNLLQDIKVKNSKITQAQLNRARGSLQVHTAAILLNQIDNNLGDADGLVFVNKKEIKELAAIVKDKIDSTYGANTYEKLINLSNIGATPDFNSKKDSLDFLLKIDNNARPIQWGEEFETKLKNLVEKQKQLETEKAELEIMYGREISIGSELSEAKVNKLNQMLRLSKSEKDKKAARFMLDINREIRFSKEELSHDAIHHREHLTGKANHTHKHATEEVELDDVPVEHYHEHSHDGHTHKH